MTPCLVMTVLPLLLHHPCTEAKATVEKILKEEVTDPYLVMGMLGKFWKIRVWFDQPVSIPTRRYWVKNPDGSKSGHRSKTVSEHVFTYMWLCSNKLCYRTGGNGKTWTGYQFDPEWMTHVTKYEPIPEDREKKDTFDTYEQFKARFDPLFIKEEMIQELWKEHSAQTGTHYRRSDFRPIGSVGKQVMERFLRFFKGIGTGSPNEPGYSSSPHGSYGILTAYHNSGGRGKFGRDITITHQTNQRHVHYSSEFVGTGNGRYGILANKKYFLHTEDD